MSKLHILLGVDKGETDGLRMLQQILGRYSIWADQYTISYCYDEEPPSTLCYRAEMLDLIRQRLKIEWAVDPPIVIGMGWMPCEVLLGKGKTKLKNYVGTRWICERGVAPYVWMTYDPAATLFDPGIAVDISAVILAAAKEAKLSSQVIPGETLARMQNIWNRYI